MSRAAPAFPWVGNCHETKIKSGKGTRHVCENNRGGKNKTTGKTLLQPSPADREWGGEKSHNQPQILTFGGWVTPQTRKKPHKGQSSAGAPPFKQGVLNLCFCHHFLGAIQTQIFPLGFHICRGSSGAQSLFLPAQLKVSLLFFLCFISPSSCAFGLEPGGEGCVRGGFICNSQKW